MNKLHADGETNFGIEQKKLLNELSEIKLQETRKEAGLVAVSDKNKQLAAIEKKDSKVTTVKYKGTEVQITGNDGAADRKKLELIPFKQKVSALRKHYTIMEDYYPEQEKRERDKPRGSSKESRANFYLDASDRSLWESQEKITSVFMRNSDKYEKKKNSPRQELKTGVSPARAEPKYKRPIYPK